MTPKRERDIVHYLPYFILGDVVKHTMTGDMRTRLRKHWILGATTVHIHICGDRVNSCQV